MKDPTLAEAALPTEGETPPIHPPLVLRSLKVIGRATVTMLIVAPIVVITVFLLEQAINVHSSILSGAGTLLGFVTFLLPFIWVVLSWRAAHRIDPTTRLHGWYTVILLVGIPVLVLLAGALGMQLAATSTISLTTFIVGTWIGASFIVLGWILAPSLVLHQLWKSGEHLPFAAQLILPSIAFFCILSPFFRVFAEVALSTIDVVKAGLANLRGEPHVTRFGLMVWPEGVRLVTSNLALIGFVLLIFLIHRITAAQVSRADSLQAPPG